MITRRRLSLWMAMAAVAAPTMVRAEDKGGASGARQARSPVRAGPTTVTVIDENETVDDVISRIRDVRLQRGDRRGEAAATPPAPQKAAGEAGQDRRARLKERQPGQRVRERRLRERRIERRQLERRRDR